MNSISEDSPDGYVLEIDLEYSDKLHDVHNDYLLAPEKLEISNDILSNYCSKIIDKYGIKVGGVNNSVPNLGNKNKYVVNYNNLQLYLSLGIKLLKINEVLNFKQWNWLKEYINFSINKRQNAGSSFEKDFFKLMNSSINGKTMENFRKMINFRLVDNAKDYVKYACKETKFCLTKDI